MEAAGFLCYPVHEKSPLAVWWFVVNSRYRIEDDFRLLYVEIAEPGNGEEGGAAGCSGLQHPRTSAL